METAGRRSEHVAENFWFVFFAYFLVITAWYSVSRNVFVSSRWRTVAETQIRGHRDLFVMTLPVLYLGIYVYFQAKSGDYTEACVSCVAIVVAILHMLRTVLGLWQLYVFKNWAVRSICSMESLGYRVQLPGGADRGNPSEGESSASTRDRARAHFVAGNIIVNDTIVGNLLSEGYVQCSLRFFSPRQNRGISSSRCFVTRASWTLLYAVKRTMCLGSTGFLLSREPEELWLRWATVLVSCAFPTWIAEMRKSHSEVSFREESEHHLYRDRFAEDILRGASLLSSGCLRSFRNWRKFPKLSCGMFSKQEFLKHACTTGIGFPFQAPHKHAATRVDKDLLCSYVKYRSKLEEARDALPVKEGEKLSSLGIEEMEWLAIILSVEDWSAARVEEDKDHGNRSKMQPAQSDTSGIAIENLRNQLGFLGNHESFAQRLVEPFLNGNEGATLWGNRNVLILSAQVDNWLALLAGEQVAYLVQQVPSMEEGLLFSNFEADFRMNQTREPVGGTAGLSEESFRLENQSLKFHQSAPDLEHLRLKKTLTFLGCSMENLRSSMAKWVESNPEQQSNSWAPTLCFSGVSNDAMNGGKFEFRASKDFELCILQVPSMSCWSQRYLQMRLLWELQNSLHNTLPLSGVSPTKAEAILLCILSFPVLRVTASEIERTPNSNTSFCCIKINDMMAPFCIEDCKLTIRASHGPQNVHIEVFFTKQETESEIAVTAQLCGDKLQEGKSFFWELWRDAFYGSLQSACRSQGDCQVANPSLPVRPCMHSIGEGICEIETTDCGIGPILTLWKGWPPHRETLAKYEIMTDGLILERKKTNAMPATARVAFEKRSTFVERPLIEHVPVSYEAAGGQYLAHASLISQNLLRTAVGCSEGRTGDEICKQTLSKIN